MSEAHKFVSIAAAKAAFGEDFPWKASAAGHTWVWDAKAQKYVSVSEGQFIYKVADRYEVRDTEELPPKVKPATEHDVKPVEKAVDAKVESKKDEDEK